MAAMASHRGADAWHQGGTRWITQRASSCPHHNSEMVRSVVIEIPVTSSQRSISDAIAIGAAWRPEVQEEVHTVVSEGFVSHPQNQSESVVLRTQMAEMQSKTSRTSHVTDSSYKNPKNLPYGHPTTQVVVHDAVPQGQRFLPVTLNEMVTMIHIGNHGEQMVYEPINH